MKKIIIEGVIGWDVYNKRIREELQAAGNEEILIEISSPGGFVFEGLTIFNTIRDYARNNNFVTTKLTGLAASMASYIAMAGDKVTAEDNAVFMIHNVWSIVVGDYREMKKESEEIEKLTALLANAYARKSGKNLKEIRNLMNEETYFYGDEAKKAGFIDEMIESDTEADRETNLALAKQRIKDCLIKMKDSERSKNDIKKAAAYIPTNEIKSEITTFKNNAKLIDEEWSKSESESRWRTYSKVKDNEDLPNKKYNQRFVWNDSENNDKISSQYHKFPIWDHKNSQGEFVNISAVRNGLARIGNSDLSEADKNRVKSVLEKYLDKFKEETEENMNLTELKNNHPELYNEVFSSGVKSVTDNIDAHSAWFEYAPNQVMDAIKKNEPFTTKHASLYSKEQFVQNQNKARKDDDQEQLNPPLEGEEQNITLQAFSNALNSGA